MFQQNWILILLMIVLSDSTFLDSIPDGADECFRVPCKDTDECFMGPCKIRDDSNRKENLCYCDQCLTFGDCCRSKEVNVTQLRRLYSDPEFQCVNIDGSGHYYYTKTTCLDEFRESDLSKMCAQNSERDVLLKIPATNLETNVTYKNIYCAMCNNERIDDLEIWIAEFECRQSFEDDVSYSYFVDDDINRTVTGHDEVADVSYSYFVDDDINRTVTGHDEDEFVFIDNSWEVRSQNAYHKSCSINIRHRSDRPRICSSEVKSCSANWTDIDVEKSCYSYTSPMTGGPNTYRNYHCAKCNWIDDSKLECWFENHVGGIDIGSGVVGSSVDVGSSFVVLPVLFDFGKRNCLNGEIWDSVSKKCRVVVCLNAGYEFRNERCVKINNLLSKFTQIYLNETIRTNTNRANPNQSEIIKCDMFFINESEFTMRENGSVFVNNTNRTYTFGQYEIYEGGILACIVSNNYLKFMGWLSIFGLIVSCLCLVLHLIAFTVVSDLRNLPGKNLTSMCIALLIAYLSFLISLLQTDTNNCPIIASIMYYFFIASFTWMNIISFDIWMALKLSTTELRLSSGAQWKKFSFYSLFAWVQPLMLLIFILTIDYTKPSWIDQSYLPELGYKFCWFGQRKAILIYFATPLAVIMLFNIIFFVLAIRIVTIPTTFTNSKSHEVRLKLCFKLALIMGLSWVTGIVGGFVQNEYVWYIFIILNAFQGLYVFISFTCTKKVMCVFKKSCYRVIGDANATVFSNTKSTSLQVTEILSNSVC